MFLSIGAIVFDVASCFSPMKEIGYLKDGEVGIILECLYQANQSIAYAKILCNNGLIGWVSMNRLVNLSGIKICNAMGY
jgi:hypothetical protein